MTQGHQVFAGELTRLAAELADPRLSSIAASLTAPPAVVVGGRRGVGRRTVAAALTAAGVRVAAAQTSAHTAVYVVAEAVKPEDAAAVKTLAGAGACRRPVLVVLNKADLSGRARVADVAAATGAPAAPMSGLWARAALEDRLDTELWATVRTLAAQPGDFRSAEHFISRPHRVPRQVRQRLCAVLDLSGIERMLEVARRDGTAAQARLSLRRLSGVDGVVARLAALGAGVQHRRISEAVARLEALAVGRQCAARIDEFLTGDATVTARMSAAVAAVGEQYLPGESALQRARRWQAHRSAPVGIAGQACAGDIARAALRDWAASRSGR